MAEIQPEDDGLLIPPVGRWSADKHYYLQRYINIFTVGMKNKPWSLHYIDLFAGAGIEAVDGIGLQWGSPLIAAQARNPFNRIHFCEKHRKRFEALTVRLKRFPQPNPPQVIRADANERIRDIVANIPVRGTLSLAFLDPYGLHLHFNTLKTLAEERRVDLIIFFPDHLDALRNYGFYGKQKESNLDRFLGTDWRRQLNDVPLGRRAEELRVIYEHQIAKLGYGYFDRIRIRRTDGVPLYQLIFCSKHERGGEFWRKIVSMDRAGQRGLFD